MKNKPTISIALATHDEANIINQCLDSVISIANEFVVYDASSSNDITQKLKKYKNLVLVHGPNHPIFHKNKQAAIDRCTKDWILQLDADEVVTPQLAKEIVNKVATNPPANGFWIKRKNYFLGHFLTKGGIYPDPTIRLYRRGFGHISSLDVHEQAVVDGTVGHLQEDLLHYSDPTFSRFLLRNDRYTTLLASELYSQNMQLNCLNFLNYFIFKPTYWFFLAFFRHRGYVDKFPGFIFAFYSALRFPSVYVKLWEMKYAQKI